MNGAVTSDGCDNLKSGLTVSVFYVEGTEHANQDRWFVQSREHKVRVGVVDGVTPWRATDKVVARVGDVGQWAAETTVKFTSEQSDVYEALMGANEELYDDDVTPSRRQAMAATVVADCWLDEFYGQVAFSGVVAADCDLWVGGGHDQPLVRVVGGDFLTASARSVWDADAVDRVGLSLDEVLELEAVLLDDPATQHRHAVGRYRYPTIDRISGLGSVVVFASDGACLSEICETGGTPALLPQCIEQVLLRSIRDDLTCVVVSLSQV